MIKELKEEVKKLVLEASFNKKGEQWFYPVDDLSIEGYNIPEVLYSKDLTTVFIYEDNRRLVEFNYWYDQELNNKFKK